MVTGRVASIFDQALFNGASIGVGESSLFVIVIAGEDVVKMPPLGKWTLLFYSLFIFVSMVRHSDVKAQTRYVIIFAWVKFSMNRNCSD